MKKLIITESQWKMLFEEERLAQFLQYSLNESKNIDILKEKIKKAIAVGATAAAIISAIAELKVSNDVKEELTDFVKTEQVDSAFVQKVQACEEYMKMALKNQGYTLNDTDLTPEKLVTAARNSSFDLPFLMAAAHQESCFGANNRAKRTNSVFSVGSYDNGKDTIIYNHPNDSVDGYLSLLQQHYLSDGKTIFDLMQPGGFVNDIGLRYAKDPNYERKIKSIRSKIIKLYPELM